MEKICVIGSGYVGLVTATCFADLGNHVVTVDIDERKIQKLKQGVMPIYEPGLEELVERNVKAGRLEFTTSYAEGLADAQFVFICVGTPSAEDGEAEMKYVRKAAQTIGEEMKAPLIVVNKSTVPVGTGDWTSEIIRKAQAKPINFAVVSCPEFLREGSAISDFMNPDRNVFGSTDREAAEQVATLYSALGAPAVITDIRTSEMIKYASNAFLATRISFINEISVICERLGADVSEVARGMGLDKRIGPHFLNAGAGYGGSCFPKDVKALANMALTHGTHPQLLNAVMEINDFQRKNVVMKIRDLLDGSVEGKVIGLLGLAFKPNTDDIRDAPALTVARTLMNQGAIVRAYDPVAMENVREEMPSIQLCGDSYEVADGADILVIMTEWNEFKQLDMARLKSILKEPIVVDGRNLYKPETMRELGFIYRGVGRGFKGEGVFATSGD
jgi:UDPglucose 6-dehydrogenase